MTPHMLIEDRSTVEREAARRRASGGELVEMPCFDRLAAMFDGFNA